MRPAEPARGAEEELGAGQDEAARDETATDETATDVPVPDVPAPAMTPEGQLASEPLSPPVSQEPEAEVVAVRPAGPARC